MEGAMRKLHSAISRFAGCLAVPYSRSACESRGGGGGAAAISDLILGESRSVIQRPPKIQM